MVNKITVHLTHHGKGTIVSSLTPHQARVLQMMLDGKCNKEIASDLGVSRSTAMFHISRIYDKFGLAPERGQTKRWLLIGKLGRFRVIWEPSEV